jgi:mannosyltransferase
VGPDTASADQGERGDETAAPPAAPARSGWARRRVEADPALVGITLGALALRAWGLAVQSLWYDEWLTLEAMDGGPRHLVRHVADREGIPLPFFAVMWLWTRLFGDGEVALRSLAVLAGVATVPVAYALVHRVDPGSRGPARAAALLVAVSPMAVWYSQEARPYALLCLAGGVVVLAAARAAGATPPARHDVALLAAAAAGAVAVHYFAAFLVVAVGIALLVTRRPAWRTWLLAGVPAGLVLLALAPLAITQHSHEANRAWITGFPLPDRLGDAGRSALVGPSPPASWLWPAGLVAVVVGVGAGLTRASPAERRAAGALLAVGGGAVVLATGAALVGVDAVIGRYLIASLVPLAAGVAAAAGRRRRGALGWAGPAALAVLVGVSLVTVAADARDDELQRPDWRSVARAFEDDAAGVDGPRALVVDRYGNLAGPLSTYLDEARALRPGESAEVAAVDLVVALPSDAPCNFLVGRACSLVFLGSPPPEPLAGALGPPQRQGVGQFALDRYRPPGPVEVSAEAVRPDAPPAVLILVLDN